MAKRDEGRRGSRRSRATEFRFKISAYTPETMPMARLAEYLSELAKVLGEEKSVHLIAIEPGSTVTVQHIEKEAIPKVKDRTRLIALGEGPDDAQRAHRNINEMLRKDNATAVFRKGIRGAKILEFPGIRTGEDELTIAEHGTLSGILVRIGGTQDEVRVTLELERGEKVSGIYTNRRIAKELAKLLFDPVRLTGKGTWLRDAGAEWRLRRFRIDQFSALRKVPLAAALDELRAEVGEFPEGAYADLLDMRDAGTANGPH
jgi:hypothetical protein